MRPMMHTSRRDWRLFALIGLALAGLLVYTLLTLRFPIETSLRLPRSHVGSLTQHRWTMALMLACAGIALHSSYIAAVMLCWDASGVERLLPIVWGYGVAAAAVLVLLWPVTSTDMFDYIFRGHMAAQYGANPYIVLPNRFRTDTLFVYLGWPNAPSAYGPLWELMSARMAAIGGTSVWSNLLLHKGLAIATFLACGALIARIAGEAGPKARLLGSALWLWSPLAIWEIAAIGHNDGFLVLSLLLAVWATAHGRYNWATAALVIGGLFKFLPFIVLPLVVAHAMRREQPWSRRLVALLEMGAIVFCLTVLSYAPYWEGLATLRNIALREKFLNAAPLSLVTYTLSQWWAIDTVRPRVSLIGSMLLGAGILWQMRQIWRHGRDLRTACFGLLVWYLVIASQWFQPWYVLWLLALLAIKPAREHFGWIETWALSGQASYLLAYFILFWLGWAGNELRGQILYFLIIFVPPLIVWWINRSRQRMQPSPASGSPPVPAA